MKKILVAGLLFVATSANAAEQLCNVRVCNKLERWSLSITAHIKDSIGKTCFDIVLPKSQASIGAVLGSESRWYQGSSINPTKKSVTRVEDVYSCWDIK